jgi:arabinose-5-phosphate isomerase
MTKTPRSVSQNILATEALFIMNDKSITALPVTENNKIIGIIHIHEIIRAGIT